MVKYKFNEDIVLANIKEYIDKTYKQHYGTSKIQTTEFVFDAGHGEGFCIGNIIKYAQRYGKKYGNNPDDLLKIIHYTIFLLGEHEDIQDWRTKLTKEEKYTSEYNNGNNG